MELEKIKKEWEHCIGRIVLLEYQCVILMDIVEDEDDVYFQVANTYGGISNWSVICGICQLHDKVDKSYYDMMVYRWNLNSLLIKAK